MARSSNTASKLTFGEKLFLFMLICFMLDLFNFKLFGFGVTLGRTLILPVLVICLFEKLQKSSFRPDSTFYIGILLIVSIFLSLFSSSDLNLELTKRLMPSYLLGSFVFVVSYVMFSSSTKALRGFKWVIASWTIIVISLSAYNLFYFYILEQAPFPNLLEQHQILFTPSKRIFLPTSSPPHLSLIAGILCLWWLVLHLGYQRVSYLLISFTMFCLCVLTFSRSGFLALSLGAATLMLLGAQSKTLVLSRRFVVISILILGVGIAFPFLVELFANEIGSNVITRLIDFDYSQIQEEKHFLYRTQAFQLFTEGTLMEKLFGIGVGNFERIEEGSTYSFSIYLTLLAEQGLLGFLLIATLLFGLVFKLYKSFARIRTGSDNNKQRIWNLLCLSLSLLVAVGNMFYEFKSFVPMWIILAWLCASAKQFASVRVQNFMPANTYPSVSAGRAI